jgi:hypothetical protein
VLKYWDFQDYIMVGGAINIRLGFRKPRITSEYSEHIVTINIVCSATVY